MIYVTGDLHGGTDYDKLSLENFPEQNTMTKDDYLIITGDFGLVFNNLKHELELREDLASRNFTTLFVSGNHENFHVLDSLTKHKWNGGQVNFINDSIIHLCTGHVFEIQGLKFFAFGGADSLDKEFRTEGRTWWAREMPSDEEYAEGIKNLTKHNWKVDYILTHDCSIRTFEKLKELAWVDAPQNPLRDYLDMIEDKVVFKKWFFGHYHDELEVDDKHTLLYRSFVRII